jgi:hypothetical protein
MWGVMSFTLVLAQRYATSFISNLIYKHHHSLSLAAGHHLWHLWPYATLWCIPQMKTGRQLLWNSGFYNFWIFSSVAFYWRFFYQVVNLKEAREFSTNKKFIYVFKVIYPSSLVLICVSNLPFHIITLLFL